jgi:hypothetical protein
MPTCSESKGHSREKRPPIAIQAGAVFIDLVEALERGDFSKAGTAQKQLRGYGYNVALRPRRQRGGNI